MAHQPVSAAAKALIAAISNDDSKHGGLLSRQTIRKADELRIALARFEAAPTPETAP
ncbi:hypothetical protein [uncultured Aureimonas sp.]|uniref:hypothetical protein n=1 Tax=uncultured Aureimonas sp. TaxID=1604662 RepID=UPI0025D97652|nr:hypothetical protein [uncultured Aureimonas sp.]